MVFGIARRRWDHVSHNCRFFGFALIIALCWLVSACSVSDVLDAVRSDGEGDAPPAPTATPPVEDPDSDAWMTRHLGHRYYFSPPVNDYDPRRLGQPATPEERALDQLAQRWLETDSVHFELDIDGTTYLDADGNIELKSAEGDLKRPNMASAAADVGIGFANFDVEMIVIGDQAYMTNFLNGRWERAPGNFDFNPALIFDDRRGIGAVVEAIDNPRMTERAEVDGRAATEINGSIPRSEVSQLVAGTLEGDPILVSLWMDPETHDLLRISLREPDDAPGDPTTWIITFSDHGAPVTIEAPDL